ncbi:hypothetical protein [Streptomyces sp. NPDC095817]|uniref:hypothetical protein n=1 Tax=Streptomyces sp. NPDC095817 TaxID=3155082 RepID=UPI003319FFB2
MIRHKINLTASMIADHEVILLYRLTIFFSALSILIVAHQQLDGLSVLIWDTFNVRKNRRMRTTITTRSGLPPAALRTRLRTGGKHVVDPPADLPGQHRLTAPGHLIADCDCRIQ